MRPALKISAVLSLIIIIASHPLYAASYQGIINANDINVRSDSTVSSRIICKINKGDKVEVVRELYEWYKIRMPKTAPSFIKKTLVTVIENNTAKVLKDNVNIRMQPSESSWILGRADKNEVVNILEDKGGWYKIEPVNDSFGWIHKSFVDKASVADEITQEAKLTPPQEKEAAVINKEPVLDETIILEGIVKPYGKVFRRNATHKLITPDKKVFFLKGNKENLDNLNYCRVKVTGKLINIKGPNPVVEITKIEALD
ncbi:MAG: SH3 domain-containing protein [Candidatus Omnitrophica bacterium]|nr:SH3 domain-containing protein [Candidatus Omnitrophota bacterium]MDD5591716.1 SH3 domain-containing protein [Candidatus Omnitrophota bacterium]